MCDKQFVAYTHIVQRSLPMKYRKPFYEEYPFDDAYTYMVREVSEHNAIHVDWENHIVFYKTEKSRKYYTPYHNPLVHKRLPPYTYSFHTWIDKMNHLRIHLANKSKFSWSSWFITKQLTPEDMIYGEKLKIIEKELQEMVCLTEQIKQIQCFELFELFFDIIKKTTSHGLLCVY